MSYHNKKDIFDITWTRKELIVSFQDDLLFERDETKRVELEEIISLLQNNNNKTFKTNDITELKTVLRSK
jgi:hypothetical protein